MKKLGVFLLPGLLFLISIRNAKATTIMVDGDPSDWPLASSVATSPQISGNPYLYADIAEVFFTNDSNYLYWRIDTYAPTNWTPDGGHFMQFCMNTDNDTSTGATSVGGCNFNPVSDFGFDYGFLINSTDSGVPSTITFYCIGNDCNPPAPPIQVASSGNVTEIRIAVSDLSISNCSGGSDCVIPTTVFSETAVNPAFNDWLPNVNETINVSIPGPTSVNLISFDESSNLNFSAFSNASFLLIISIVIIFVALKRPQTKSHID